METALTLRTPSIARHVTRALVRHVPTGARIILGLIFFVFGLNGFLNFIPPPSHAIPDGAMAFGMAMMKTGYIFPLIKGTEVFAGALLLSNRFVPLALAVIAPVIVNIVAFHVFLAPSGSGLAFVILALELYLAWSYRGSYRAMLALHAVRH
jgi:hypothetical protein